MSRKYQHTMELLPQIQEMLAGGMTQKEVADLLGISQSYISRIEKKVIKKIRNLVKI